MDSDYDDGYNFGFNNGWESGWESAREQVQDAIFKFKSNEIDLEAFIRELRKV